MSTRQYSLLASLIALLLLLATLLGCKATDQASPARLPDGSTTITAKMVDIWSAPGGPKCRWWMQSSKGSITNGGNTTGPVNRRAQKPGRTAEQSQTVVIGHGNIGDKLKSDGCGGWTK